MQYRRAFARGLPQLRQLRRTNDRRTGRIVATAGRGDRRPAYLAAARGNVDQDRLPVSRARGPERRHGAGSGRNPARRARLFDRAADILGYDLAQLCFEGPAEELDSTVYSQPALFVTSLAAVESLRRAQARRAVGLRSRGRPEPGRIHGPGVCRRDGFRDRPAVGAAARRRDARRRRRHAQRHGQHSGARSGRGRPDRRRMPAATTRWKSPTCFARATSSFRATMRHASAWPNWRRSAGR